MKRFFLHSIIFSSLLSTLYSCEFIARSLLTPNYCMVYEVRMTESRWAEEPVWKEKGCGGKLTSLEDLCEEEAKKRGGFCDCIFYTK